MRPTLNKKLVLLVLAGFTFIAANAQIQFGVKAGANFATLTGSDVSGAKTRVSFNAGALVKIPIADQFSVQPELVYSSQGAKGSGSDGTTTVDFSLPVNYLNVPILLKYSTSFGFFAETGPQVGFLMSAHEKAGSVSVDVKSAYKSTDFSWVFGVGYLTTANVGIDLRYNLGLTSIGKAVDGETPSVKNGVIQLGVFYMFGGSGRD